MCKIAIAGGGWAGCAAAVRTAKLGIETVLVEKTDLLLGTFVNVADAAVEAGRIINSYKSMDIDFTVLLTHIGFEEDKKLAALLDPEWGVDVIIGGHTHTFPD